MLDNFGVIQLDDVRRRLEKIQKEMQANHQHPNEARFHSIETAIFDLTDVFMKVVKHELEVRKNSIQAELAYGPGKR